ncbi:MAG: hypothetical protein WAX69_26955 [Victivallales bacterium]
MIDFSKNGTLHSKSPLVCWLRNGLNIILSGIALTAGIQDCPAMGNVSMPPGITLVQTKEAGPFDLRGYGQVSAKGSLWQGKEGELSLVRFHCQNAESAKILASKYLEDMLAYGAVKVVETPSGLGGTMLEVRHGGVWLLGLNGEEMTVASAPSAAALAEIAKSLGADLWQSIPEHAYPRYLDNFDNDGLGFWWMPNTKSPEIMAWLKEHPVSANLHPSGELGRIPATGVYDLSGSGNAIAQLRQLNMPYRWMLNASVFIESGSWLNWFQLPGHQLEIPPAGDIGGEYWFNAAGDYKDQIASPLVNTILQDSVIQSMRRRVTDPDLLGWMEPHGEFVLFDPATIPPDYERRFPDYLKRIKNYSLSSISEAYAGDRKAYRSWEEIPYPDTAFFRGRRGSFVDLDDQPWRWRSGPLEAGEKAGWAQASFNDAEWTEELRESKRLLSQSQSGTGLWFRFTHSVTEDFLKATSGRKVFLHVMPQRPAPAGELTVWINGTEVMRQKKGDVWNNPHVQAEVGATLKPGANHFVIFCNAGPIVYRVFLSDTPVESFPFAEKQLTRRYLDWRDYMIWEKLQTLESYLRVMRSVDPVRPIKVMTPELFLGEAMDLCERYGAYPHLTGECSWYRPMHYKGYSALRRIPGSSEPGGPMPDARSSQLMFAMTFWESQDCHDYVFDTARDFWSKPEVVKWWTDNWPLLRTLGKTDFAEFKLGMLRDARQDHRYESLSNWDWDLSRGPLPSMGLPPVLVDGTEFMKGRADHLPVIIDCATTVMEPELVKAVRRYVEKGGTFIALHHTGQHSPEQRNAWPLAEQFGLRIEPKLVTSGKLHEWPLGNLKFTMNQELLPSLQGKECKGSGVSIDFTGKKSTAGAIAIHADSPNVHPVAYWNDGTMAAVDVRAGKGRFILLGTPFFMRFMDDNGKWLNGRQCQELLEEMLGSLGIKRETRVGDDRVWLERRESKNGLYDVYFACAMGISGNAWKLTDKLESNLSAVRVGPVKAIETTANGVPDVPTEFAEGKLSFGLQSFTPYQVRQFAVLRDNAGLQGPLHWLEVQRRHWRAIEAVPSSLADSVVAQAAEISASMDEKGMDLNCGWKVLRNPADPKDTTWLNADTSDPRWTDGSMGSWLANGWKDTTCVQYRKRVEIPRTWRGANQRVLMGMTGFYQFGLRDRGSIWVNGKARKTDLSGLFSFDVTAEAATGTLDLAIQVEGNGLERGSTGTLFLRGVPSASDHIDLPDGWTRMENWEHDAGTLTLPLDGKTTFFGLKHMVKIPKDWSGRQVRLALEYDGEPGQACIQAVLINRTGYVGQVEAYPPGPRLDRWLRPGEDNELMLLGFYYMDKPYAGVKPKIRAIRLEAYPEGNIPANTNKKETKP